MGGELEEVNRRKEDIGPKVDIVCIGTKDAIIGLSSFQ